jgi:hypothetical protein
LPNQGVDEHPNVVLIHGARSRHRQPRGVPRLRRVELHPRRPHEGRRRGDFLPLLRMSSHPRAHWRPWRMPNRSTCRSTMVGHSAACDQSGGGRPGPFRGAATTWPGHRAPLTNV